MRSNYSAIAALRRGSACQRAMSDRWLSLLRRAGRRRGHMLGNAVGIIAQQHRFVRIARVFPVSLLDDAAQPEHAQADAHRIAEVSARHMHMGALRPNLLD